MEQPAYRVAEELDRFLGDPGDPARPFSHTRCVELDEKEEFPADICRQLEEWGLTDYYVPVEHGGRLRSYEQVLQLMRTVARRDLTVAVGHGKTYLGGVCVWVSGTPEQARRLGADIRAGVPVSLGLTERAHGSDLLAGEVTGAVEADGWLVSGEKWLINNATRGSVFSLLTRTDPAGGPRGFSVLLVDKRKLGPGSYRHLPKVRTHGIRGADISGIAFDGARVDREDLVGTEGGGLETVLKALQLTRTMCASLSLGAADHGLRIAVDFAEERELYGRHLIDLPQARSVLSTAAADVLLHEALAVFAARAVHTQTDELSVTAAVTKYLLPSGTEAVLAALTRVLGARAFLKGVYAGGMFQKIERDHRIVGLFDGNTLVNLNSLINQFRSLVRGRRRGTGDSAGAVAAYDLSAPVPALDPARLSLVARHGSGVLAGLDASVAELSRRAGENPALRGAVESAERLVAVERRVHAEMESRQSPAGEVEPEVFDLARRYTLCYAGAACLGLWLHSSGAAAGGGGTAALWQDGLWLRAALGRILERLGEPGSGDAEAYEGLLAHLRAGRRTGELFSLLPQRLPEPLPLESTGATAGTS
ncbi:alkylation response protein AidB-like acyl-CoA dehydrogenase [Streptomyces sp. 840.1]|uniref:acyl-CoA dehydrogenase family protein n=1 Tax=Streptomyces sp. 840.1 TaxID=2485152 RepID=UPI000F4ADF60|nr:acyl-CoA dehydrogenase family protein [Streptomyces sp. 840.1]ROQ67124.1 alkylation response protein AidB-like acyl-CoA dehydrogenase [Streptomyces sp. 840.1]